MPDLASFLKRGNAFRLLDDISIGFDSESDAKQALRALRQALWKYNLQLNDEKTKITTSPLLFREKWKLEFETTPLSQVDSQKQLREIDYIVDLALNSCHETNIATPAQWACRRLSRAKILDGTLGAILDALFRLARDFPICVNYVVSFLINNQTHCTNDEIKLGVRRWILSILKLHLPQGHHFEVAWCLIAAGVLNIKLNKEDVPADGIFPGSIVLSIFGLLRERSLLNFPLSRWDWRGRIRGHGAFGEDWLLLYESVRRNWTNDPKLLSLARHPPYSHPH
ncbi:RNA-directed DNA polymerase [Nitrobacter sp. TKz-YC02]|uniref:RNA-directed DNA polymerase n=1 Tax=Nitrobacter sp. TKz-YC02 TaxID=3398704 RepID=UPI003CF3A527